MKKWLSNKIALVLISSLVLTLVQFQVTQAGALTARSITLASSDFSTASAEVIKFTTETALSTGATSAADFSVVLNYPTDAGGDPFTMPTFTTADITSISLTSCSSQAVAVTAVEMSNNGGHSANDELLIAFNETGQDSVAVPAGCVFQFTLGNTNKMTNPANGATGCTANSAGTADTCSVTIQTSSSITGASPTIVDSGSVLVGFIEGVTVSASVNETLSFSMAQGAACSGDSGSPTSINGSVTATTVPFGTMTADAFKVGCQDLTVSTNGAGGYSVTGEEDNNLKTVANVTISDTICDSGPCTESSGSAWATASANQGLGYYCENVTNTPCSTAGDTTSEYRQFACKGADAVCNPGTGVETAQTVLTESSTAASSKGRVHYKLSISGSQGAGSYTNTVRYIATPIY